MKIIGVENELHPGITMHKIPVKSGFPGLLFTIGMMAVYLMGIPDLIYFLVLAVVLGIGVAVMLRFIPRQAGLVMFVFTVVVLVWLVGPLVMDDWRRGQELSLQELSAAIMAPPPPPSLVAPSRWDCHPCQTKQSCDSTTQHHRKGQKKRQPQSPFNGTWEGKMNDLPGVNLTVADAGGGTVGGIVTFYFQTKGDDGKWRVAGKFAAPMLAVCPDDKTLTFEVQHHRAHNSPDFGPNVKFQMELAKTGAATLENLEEDPVGPIRLTRRN